MSPADGLPPQNVASPATTIETTIRCAPPFLMAVPPISRMGFLAHQIDPPAPRFASRFTCPPAILSTSGRGFPRHTPVAEIGPVRLPVLRIVVR